LSKYIHKSRLESYLSLAIKRKNIFYISIQIREIWNENMRMYTTSDNNNKRKAVQIITSGIVYVCSIKVYIIGFE